MAGSVAVPAGTIRFYLDWVPQNKGSGGKGDLVDGPEGAAEIDRLMYARLAIEAAAELTPEMTHQVDG